MKQAENERRRHELMESLAEMRQQQEREEQIDAVCAYLGVELVKTKSGLWKCIKAEEQEGKK